MDTTVTVHPAGCCCQQFRGEIEDLRRELRGIYEAWALAESLRDRTPRVSRLARRRTSGLVAVTP